MLITWTELSDLPWTFLLLGLVILITDVFSFKQERKISEFYGIFKIFPETQAKLTQRQRKFELFNPSQAKLEEQQAQLRCSSAALSSDYITRPVALVQHCSIAAEEQHRGAAGTQQQQGG